MPAVISSDFGYDRLDPSTPAIRVFRISPAESINDPISCQMYQIPEPEGHTAISYVWGPADFPCTVELNGRSFAVTKVLLELLQRLRHVFGAENRQFWIDAVCIDQKSVDERNHQVRQMGRIYQDADMVIASVRPPGLATTEKEHVHDLHLLIQRVVAQPTFPSFLQRSVARVVDSMGIECFTFWSQLYQLCHAEFWSRAWIVQEILLNRHTLLMSGYHSVDRTVFFNFLTACAEAGIRAQKLSGYCESDINRWPATRLATLHCRPPLNANIYTYLGKTKTSYCSDQRDRVYSLLTLSRLKIDVRYDEPVEDLAMRVVSAVGCIPENIRDLLEALSDCQI
jgi:hypothetical protein